MKKVTCAGGLVVSGENILLIKGKSGNYSLPKGHVEEGETFEMTALREVEEETGYRTKILKYLGEYTRISDEHNGTKVEKTIKVYLLKQIGYTKKMHDEKPEWVRIHDAINNMHFEQEVHFLNQILST
jgi:8-oxo-dGTP pyrophosphatase MutT (NUDIX family)